ncbi:MAG TPA: zf-HC2 domain-containing protein [Amycolatopsis sp.]|uniref:zf-HC2 domain-containing protein n=1 Tax=Amycolatopsis sp. TaxID=37632 RepID=UPI002B47CF28|nr:zf-HC2 domain-containing protein [Amycolatopsis sp.]HKS44687.1 zf-HC2 domain-containing protein [Amycolatopsis sp.]
MDCATAREAISATLDGEDPGVEPAALDLHVDGCPACASWRDDAAAVTRLARLAPAGETPDVTAEVVSHFSLPTRLRSVDWGRWALVFAAVSQFSIVVSMLLLPQPMGDGMSIAPSSHLEHEAAAFNFAVAVALLWVAARPNRARSQLPVLLSFAVLLVSLSLVDIVSGHVGWYRLASHIPLLIGVLCTVLIGGRDSRWPWPGNRASGHRARRAGTGRTQDEAAPTASGSRHYRPPAAWRDVA